MCSPPQPAAFFAGQQRRFRVRVPIAAGRALAMVRGLARVEQDDADEQGVDLVLRVEQRQLGRLRAWAEAEGLRLVRA